MFMGFQPPSSRKPDQCASVLMRISDSEFRRIRDLVYDRFGINLTEAKKTLVVGRLQKVIRTMGFHTFSDFYNHLIRDKSGASLDTLINRISTNHTFFYRESEHFDYFCSQALPEIITCCREIRSRDLRLWCAGCSSGEEPYMLVMLMLEFFGEKYRHWNAGVLATDISATALEKAMAAQYSEESVRQVPPHLLRKYFRRTVSGRWEVVEAVRKEVTLRRFNLINTEFPFSKPFHIIFCRNVMIYFDQPTRMQLVRRFHRHMVPGGYLFIGHSESLSRERTLFKFIKPAVYRKML